MMVLDLPDDDFRPFRLEDRDLLERAFRDAGYRLCEYSFATQFCWRAFNESRWARAGGWLLVRYLDHGEPRFLCPIGPGDPTEAILACMDRLVREGAEPRVDYVPESVRLRLADDPRFAFEPDAGNDDYVYLRSDLAELAGKKYARKRNHVARFLRDGRPWSFDRVGPADMPALGDFLKEWCAGHGCEDDPRLDFEMRALGICLENLEALGQQAAVLRREGRIVGMALGELLTPDTLVVHYEKALTDVDGAYQVLAREFARTAPAGVAWIDREQDMGHEGLRASKLSFYPDHMERCWVARSVSSTSTDRDTRP
jgi:uncharacterized protein